MMPTPDDRPLTIADIDNDLHPSVPLHLLAERVITHLPGEWAIVKNHHGSVIVQDGEDSQFTFLAYHGEPYNPYEFHIRTFTLTGRPGIVSTAMSVYTLPSQIAAHLTADVIPKMRKRLDTARQQQTRLEERNKTRKAFIDRIARRLSWNSSSYKAHSGDVYASQDPRYGRRRKRDETPTAIGHIGYADRGTGMNVYLTGLDEKLVAQIVDLVDAHYTPRARRWPRALRPSPRRLRAQRKVPDGADS